MLFLLNSITVPGTDIELFRDHEQEDLFYVVPSIPRVARDPQGKPLLSYLFIARDADIAYASSENKDLVESQLGQLLITTDLGISEEEGEKIKKYLKEHVLPKKDLPFNRFYYRLLKKTMPQKAIEPKLTYPNTWKDGSAQLQLLEGFGDTFKKKSSEPVVPSMVASNSAAFYATLGIEGSQVYFDALSKGFKGQENEEEPTPLQAIVNYHLKGYAYAPNLKIEVIGHASQVYEYLQEREVDFEREVKEGKRTKHKEVKILGIPVYKSEKTYTTIEKVTLDKEDISTLVEEMVDRKIITIKIEDFGDLALNSAEKKEVEDNVRIEIMGMIMNTIIPSFFETALIGDKEDQPVLDEEGNVVATVDPEKPQADPNMPMGWRARAAKDLETHYHFKNDIEKTKINNIYFKFERNGTIEFQRNPQGTLTTQLNESEREALVRYIDVSSPEVQILEVQLSVNADFEEDKIHSVVVNIYYKQKDHKSGVVRENTESYLFDTGDEKYIFRATMARNAQGELLDYYDVEAKITYKGTSEAPPPIKLINQSGRQQVVSYDKLGFLTVKTEVGDIDWEVIDKAVVDFEYKAEPDQPDTRKQITLDQNTTQGTWKTFMYMNEDKTYRYQVKYYYKDGTESESEVKEDTRDTLIIDDQLIGRVRASFDLIMDPSSVKSAKIEVLYEDESLNIREEYSKWFTNAETWDWVMRLREGAATNFKYRYLVEYSDGLVEESDWMEASSDEDIPPINIRRYPRMLIVDAFDVDWTQWRRAYLNVRYTDTANNYTVSERVILEDANPFGEVSILAFRPEHLDFEYSVQFVSSGGVVRTPSQVAEGGILILTNPESVEA